MPAFFALVDALTGQEAAVGAALRALPGLTGVLPCKEANYDFLVRFDAESFSRVDDFLQTNVRRVPGVKGVEIVTRPDEYSTAVRDAMARMDRGAPKAVVLLSGGLDSAVAAALAKERGFEIHAVSFDYGQRHARELESAQAVAKALGAASHVVLHVPLGSIGGSALTDARIAVPQGRDAAAMAKEIPVTYVPARNIVFLSLALGVAETRGADAIVIGANALDYSGYPDCRPEFFQAFEEVAKRGTKRGVEGKPVRVEAPLLRLTKADIVREGLRLKAPLDLTWSCYQGGAKACGVCDSCLLRLKGFREAGATDPIAYA